MGVLALGQTPASLQVFIEVRSLLECGNDGLVKILLVGSLRLREGLLCLGFPLLKEFGLG